MMEPPVSNSTSHNPCSELGQKLQTNSAKANSNTASVSEIPGVSSNCGSEANAGVYIETMLKRAHKFFSKLDNQMLESGPVSLDRQETMGAGYAICRLAKTNKELFLDREENASHPQVTAVQKIRVALRPTKLDKAALILDKDEFQALADLFDKSNRDKALVRDPNSPRLNQVSKQDVPSKLSGNNFTRCSQLLSSWKRPHDNQKCYFPAIWMPPPTEDLKLVKQKLLQSQPDADTSSKGSEFIELTRREADILLRADHSKEMALISLRRSFEIPAKHGSARRAIINKYSEVTRLYEQRLAHLSSAFVAKSFGVYGKALSSTSRSHPQDLVSLAASRNFLGGELECAQAKAELLYAVNEKLMELANALSHHPDEPTALPDRLAQIFTALSWETFQDTLKSQQKKTAEALHRASEANTEMRKMENSRAQSLFLALADQYAQSSGPDALRKLVWDICGPLLDGIAVDCGQETPIPSMHLENPAGASPRELTFELLGFGYDFVIKDSPLSEKLAAQLKVPSKFKSVLKDDSEEGKISWRCVPSVEIEVLKMEKKEASLAYAEIFTDWQRSKVTDHPHCSQFGDPIESNVHYDPIDLLVEYIQEIHTKLIAFLSAAFDKLDQSKEKLEVESYGLPTLSDVLYGIEELKKRNQELSTNEEGLDGIATAVEHIIKSLPSFKQDYGETGKINKGLIESSLFLINTHIHAALSDREHALHALDDAVGEQKSLRDVVALKEKRLQEAEAVITRARDLTADREEKMNRENQKLESELANVKQQLEKALRVPDRVRDEFFGKIQKLHDKNRDLENKVKEIEAAREILYLDQEATIKDLESSRAKVDQQKAALKRFREEYTKLKDERDQLRSKRFPTDRDIEAALQFQEKKTEQALAQIAVLEEDKRELEEDLRNMRNISATGEKAIRQLEERIAEQGQETANLKERLADMEEIQKATLNELEKERNDIKVLEKDEAMLAYEKQLAEERAKSKRLAAKLELFFVAAVAATSL